MTTTWTEINRKLDLFLGDVPTDDTDRAYASDLRAESWNWAQRQLCYHTPRQRTMTLKLESDGRTAILPSDFYAVHAIYDAREDGELWWREMRYRPGDVRYLDDELPEFWIWGNQMFLEDDVSVDSDDLTLYYWAYYPDVTYTGSGNSLTMTQETIYTPPWAENALAHLASAGVMAPLEVFSSDISQFKIKVESGTPIQNPRMESMKFHLWWWEHVLNQFPPALDIGGDHQ